MLKKYKNIILILILPSIIGLVYNEIRTDSLTLIKKQVEVEWADDSELTNFFENDSLRTFKAIKTEQFYSLYQNGNINIIDARDEWDYRDGHIAGAINLPAYDVEENISVINDLNKKDLLVVYCGDEDCDLSKKLAQYLLDDGFQNVFIYLGGWFEWIDNGYPIEVSGDE